ncbi:MAG TPA: hypothetical protein VI357_22130 [Mycobacteriales bacterium]
MSGSSTSTGPGTRSGRGPARVAAAVAVAVAVLAPLAVLGAQVRSSTGDSLSFVRDERRGVTYLRPLTRLLGATTEAQSAAVRGRPVDAAGVRSAVAAVEEADRRVGGALRTTDRWTSVRATVADRISRPGWPQATTAYTQYSDLNTALLQLSRTVGDNSRLVLDPATDAYYVMDAALLRIPAILVDSGRYADLSILSGAGDDAAAGGPAQPAGTGPATDQAQLAAARNRIATDATDLSDGLVKAFGGTGSGTLALGLTRQLGDFRTAVDAVAPSTSLLAPVPERSLTDLARDQATLHRAALALQDAALDQLDLLLAARASDTQRTRAVALAATALGVLVAAGLVLLVWRRSVPAPAPDRVAASGASGPEETMGTAVRAMPVRAERLGGARVAR